MAYAGIIMHIVGELMNDIKYPKIINAILLCLLLIGIQIIGGCIIGLVLNFLGSTTQSLLYEIGIMIIQVLSFAVVICIGWKKSNTKFNNIFKFKKIPSDFLIYTIVFSFGLTILSSEIANIENYIMPMPEKLNDLFNKIFTNQNILLSFILVGIIPAFTEEMTFRGLFLTGFTKNYSIRKSIIVGAILFGLIHLNPWQFITVFIFGLFSGWIFCETGSILLCIYIHLFNNTVSLFSARFSNLITIKGFNSDYKIPVQFQPWWFDAIGIMLSLIGFILLKKAINKRIRTWPAMCQ
jgi:CAAX amino terminal protease family.